MPDSPRLLHYLPCREVSRAEKPFTGIVGWHLDKRFQARLIVMAASDGTWNVTHFEFQVLDFRVIFSPVRAELSSK